MRGFQASISLEKEVGAALSWDPSIRDSSLQTGRVKAGLLPDPFTAWVSADTPDPAWEHLAHGTLPSIQGYMCYCGHWAGWEGTYVIHLLVQVLGQDVQHGSGQGLAFLGQALLDIVHIDIEGPNDDAAGQ